MLQGKRPGPESGPESPSLQKVVKIVEGICDDGRDVVSKILK